MRLPSLPTMYGDLRFLNSSFRGLRLFISVITGFLGLIACIPWTPKYPVQAHVDTVPGVVKIVAPIDGQLVLMPYSTGQVVRQNQPLFTITALKSLLQIQKHARSRSNLQIQLKLLKSDVLSQTRKLDKMRVLWQKQVITSDEYQQAKAELRHRVIEHKRLLMQFWKFEHQNTQSIVAPLTGKIIHLPLQNQAMVKKNQLLMWIQPLEVQRRLKLNIPVQFRKYVYPGANLRFKLPDNQLLKRYVVQAKIIYISPVIIHKKQADLIEAYALLDESMQWSEQILMHMNLSGYLLAPRHCLLVWLFKIIFSI